MHTQYIFYFLSSFGIFIHVCTCVCEEGRTKREKQKDVRCVLVPYQNIVFLSQIDRSLNVHLHEHYTLLSYMTFEICSGSRSYRVIARVTPDRINGQSNSLSDGRRRDNRRC